MDSEWHGSPCKWEWWTFHPSVVADSKQLPESHLRPATVFLHKLDEKKRARSTSDADLFKVQHSPSAVLNRTSARDDTVGSPKDQQRCARSWAILKYSHCTADLTMWSEGKGEVSQCKTAGNSIHNPNSLGFQRLSGND